MSIDLWQKPHFKAIYEITIVQTYYMVILPPTKCTLLKKCKAVFYFKQMNCLAFLDENSKESIYQY